jgi:hypothetical protein
MMAYLHDPQFKAAKDVVKRRREQFERLNEEARLNDSWIVSTPGNREVLIEVLPGSAWPAALIRRGYGS